MWWERHSLHIRLHIRTRRGRGHTLHHRLHTNENMRNPRFLLPIPKAQDATYLPRIILRVRIHEPAARSGLCSRVFFV